jgi:uncharacterized coiled-coil protein SlyX
MLGANDTKSRIAVLEQKSDSQERLIEKVDAAIQVMKEAVDNVSKMLVVHNERIEQHSRSESLIVSMVKEMKESLEAEDTDLSDRIDEIAVKLEDVKRIKWMAVGVGIFAAVLATSISTLASGWLTPSELGFRMEHKYVPSPENIRK